MTSSNAVTPRDASSRAKVASLLLLTFAAGAIAGVAITRTFFSSPAERAASIRSEDPPPESTENQGIPRQLLQFDLTADQRTRIKQVVARRQPTADSITESVLPRVRALELTMRQEMMCELTPTQQQRWMQWRKDQGLSLAEGEDWLALVRAGKCERQPGAAR
jgi:hypothetical protein